MTDSVGAGVGVGYSLGDSGEDTIEATSDGNGDCRLLPSPTRVVNGWVVDETGWDELILLLSTAVASSSAAQPPSPAGTSRKDPEHAYPAQQPGAPGLLHCCPPRTFG